jgi:D-glycero-D-manno-heptose 1,7-bisphosphate phosphatase
VRRALFLDRDGVINLDRGYVHCREAFEFQEGIFELCRAAQNRGYLLLVVTNQAGIARGYYTEAEFLELTRWMVGEFGAREISIARVYYCPYHPVHGIGGYKLDSPDRKPRPGMLLRARGDFDLDMMSSVLVGDKNSDIEAAQRAGIGTKILLSSEGSYEDDQWGGRCYLARSLDDIRSRFFSGSLEERRTAHEA